MTLLDTLKLPTRKKGEWYQAVPPLARVTTGLTPADYFGRTLCDSLPEDQRVGVINVAVGGCKIELFDTDSCANYIATSPGWLKNMAKEYDNDPYGRLVELAKKAQRQGVIRGVLLHQGESNTGQQDWPLKVKKVYERLLSDLNLKAESCLRLSLLPMWFLLLVCLVLSTISILQPLVTVSSENGMRK